jgi:hypothetical protein
MALKFAREQAGEYNVIEGIKMVGFIQKSNASKWVVYICTNPATKGKPQNVAKTLKDSKVFCERYFEGNDVSVQQVNENNAELDNLLNDVRTGPSRKDLMREMLNNPKTIDFNFNDVDVESMDLSDIIDLGDDVPFSHFLTEEEAMAL